MNIKQSATCKFWEERYKGGGDSGRGSYNTDHANFFDFKTNYINNIIQEHKVKTINDFGCGDGNQIKDLRGFDTYKGYDISNEAVSKCSNKYENNPKYNFYSEYKNWAKADLSMSLDVLYHIMEDDLWLLYINDLFNFSNKLVLIYSVDDDTLKAPHVKSRNFTTYIKDNFLNYKLLNVSESPLMKNGTPSSQYYPDSNGVRFFLYLK